MKSERDSVPELDDDKRAAIQRWIQRSPPSSGQHETQSPIPSFTTRQASHLQRPVNLEGVSIAEDDTEDGSSKQAAPVNRPCANWMRPFIRIKKWAMGRNTTSRQPSTLAPTTVLSDNQWKSKSVTSQKRKSILKKESTAQVNGRKRPGTGGSKKRPIIVEPEQEPGVSEEESLGKKKRNFSRLRFHIVMLTLGLSFFLLPFRLVALSRPTVADGVVDVILLVHACLCAREDFRERKRHWWFPLLDPVSALIPVIVWGAGAGVWAYLATSLLKSHRAYRLLSTLWKYDRDLSKPIFATASMQVAITILGTAHVLGSVYFFAARTFDFTANPSRTTWTVQFEERGYRHGDLDSMTQAGAYALAMYRGLCSLATVAYAEFFPETAPEYFLSLVSTLASVLVAGLILGRLFNFVVRSDEVLAEHRKHVNALKNLSLEREIPQRILNEAVDHLEFQYNKTRVRSGEQVEQELPPSLLSKLAQYKHSKILSRNARIFRQCSEEYVNAILMRLREVHYWPGEVILVGGDLPRETIFLSSGTLELISEDGNIIREIFADGDPYPRAAATEFFIGLRLQFTTRVSASSDAKVFSLRKTDYDDVKAEFPNMHEQVRKNLLTSFGLTTEGVDMTEDSQKEEDDAWHRMLRGPVQEALKKRHGERLAKAMNSARSADWRSLMTYIDAGLQGRECDYDSISLVHATASSGSGYGCELLSYRGADVTAHDRWGHTPLDYALLGGWIGTGGQLHNMGSNLSSIGLGDRLVKHARSDETESLKVLLKNGADPNIGDVDQRSPLHAASRTGAIGCVHELLRAGADVSLPDPAGLRPLDDACFKKNSVAASILVSKGATIVRQFARRLILELATLGDGRNVVILLNAGCDPNSTDSDHRQPLHLAASYGQLHNCSLLIQFGGQLNGRDRWNGTALGDALLKGHLTVARLLASNGATVNGDARLGSDPEGEAKRMLERAPSTIETRQGASILEAFTKAGIGLAKANDADAAYRVATRRTINSVNHLLKFEEAFAGAHDRIVQFCSSTLPTVGAKGALFWLQEIVNAEKRAGALSESIAHQQTESQIRDSESRLKSLNKAFTMMGIKQQDAGQELVETLRNVTDQREAAQKVASWLRGGREASEASVTRLTKAISEPTCTNFVGGFLLSNEFMEQCKGVGAEAAQVLARSIQEALGSIVSEIRVDAKVEEGELRKLIHPLVNLGMQKLAEHLQERMGETKRSDMGGGGLSAADVAEAFLWELADVSEEKGEGEDENEEEESKDDSMATVEEGGEKEDDAEKQEGSPKGKEGDNAGGAKAFASDSIDKGRLWRRFWFVEPEERLWRAFDALDRDGKGELKPSELHAMLRKSGSGIHLSDTTLRATENALMAGNGTCTPKEFVEGIMTLRKSPLIGKEVVQVLEPKRLEDACTGELLLPFGTPLTIFSPTSLQRRIWRWTVEVFVGALLSAAALFNIAFGAYRNLGNSYTIAIGVLDTTLLLDIMVKFRTAFVDERSRVEVDPAKVAKKYMASEFPLDLIAFAPFDHVIHLAAVGTGTKPLYTMMSWFRLPKILRFKRFWQRLQEAGKRLDPLRYGALVIAIGHVLACALWYVGRISSFAGWNAWWDGLQAFGRDRTDMTPFQEYLVSLHMIATTMSAAGYAGNFLPRNPFELVYFMILFVGHICLFQYAVGVISSHVTKRGEELLRWRKGKLDVEALINGMGLPSSIAAQVRANRQQEADSQSSTQTAGHALGRLPVSIRNQVYASSYGPIVRECNLFQNCSKPFLNNLAAECREERLEAGATLLNKDTVAKKISFVRNGSLLLMTGSGDQVATKELGFGQCVGELGCFFGLSLSRTIVKAPSAEAVELVSVGEEDWNRLAQFYEDDAGKAIARAMEQEGLDVHSSLAGSSAASGNSSKLESNTALTDAMERKSTALEKGKRQLELTRLEEIMWAAWRNDVTSLSTGLHKGDAHVMSINEMGRTCLHVAAAEGNVEACKELMVNWKALPTKMDNQGRTAAHEAAMRAHVAVLDAAERAGIPLAPGQDAGLEYRRAAARGDHLVVHCLARIGCDVANASGCKRNAVHCAAAGGRVEAASQAIIEGTPPNQEDHRGFTPLLLAIESGHHDCAEKIFAHDGGIGTSDNTFKMNWLASTGNTKQLELYRNFGMSMGLGNYDWRTPLHVAASNNRVATASWLVTLPEVDVSAVNRNGHTPLDSLPQKGAYDVMASLLKQYGGRSGQEEDLKEKHKKLVEEEETQRTQQEIRLASESAMETDEAVAMGHANWVAERLSELGPHIGQAYQSFARAFSGMVSGEESQKAELVRSVEEQLAELSEAASDVESVAKQAVNHKLGRTKIERFYAPGLRDACLQGYQDAHALRKACRRLLNKGSAVGWELAIVDDAISWGESQASFLARLMAELPSPS